MGKNMEAGKIGNLEIGNPGTLKAKKLGISGAGKGRFGEPGNYIKRLNE